MIRFTELWPLALLILPALYGLLQRGGAIRKSLADKLAIGLRLLAIVALILALGGPQLRSQVDAHAVYFLVDRSASARAALSESDLLNRLNNWAEPQSNTEYGVIVFGKEAYVERPFRKTLEMPELHTQVDPEGTDLAGAVDLALATFPKDATQTIVLLSDGQPTGADVAPSLARARREGASVFPVPLSAPRDELAIQGLQAPDEVATDLPFSFQTVVFAGEAANARLLVYRDGALIDEQPLELHAGLNVVERRDELSASGTHTYRVELVADGDVLAENNRYEQVVRATGEPRVLIVRGPDESDPSSTLSRVLDETGSSYSTVSLNEFAPSLAALLPYRAVVFENVPLRSLTDRQQGVMERYVRDLGGGFWLIQGREAVQNFADREFEKILPVTYEGPEELRKPALGLVMVLDRSGSMGELAGRGQKIDLLKRAAMRAVGKLNSNDLVGVIGFDATHEWLVELGPVQNRRQEILRSIEGLSPNGGTDAHPALGDAVRALQGADARVRHVLIFSDGKFVRERRDFPTLFRNIEDSPITASSIAIGNQADRELMWRLAEVGVGQKYSVSDARDLPEITLEELIRLQRARWIKGPVPVRSGPFVSELRQVDPEEIPPVDGYVLTFEKSSVKTELYVGPEDGPDDPLVSTWRYGLGEVAVLNTALSETDAERWLQWPGLGNLMSDLLGQVYSESTLRPDNLDVRRELNGATLTVTVDAQRDGQWLNDAQLEGRLASLGSEPRSLLFERIAPGRYRATVEDVAEGVHLLNVGSADLGRVQETVSVPYPEEYRRIGLNSEGLRHMAETTGGRYLATIDDLPALLEDRAYAFQDIWSSLALASLILFLLDLAMRKLPLHRLFVG